MRLAVFFGLVPAALVPLLLSASGSVWPAILAYHIYCCFVGRALQPKTGAAGFVRGNPREWLPWTLIISIAAALFITVPRDWIHLIGEHLGGWDADEPFRRITRMIGLEAEDCLIFTVYSLAVNPLIEEYFWRGTVQPKVGNALAAFLFWLFHFTALTMFLPYLPAYLVSIPSFFAALFWGWTRTRYGTLWPCILSHLVIDAAILWLLFGSFLRWS